MSRSIFDLDEFKPYADTWRARQAAFATRRAYYDGSIYGAVRSSLSWLGPRIGGAIRPLYLPLARAVHLDAGIIPAHWTLTEEAAPLVDAARLVLDWSNWLTDGVLFTRFGAEFGSVGLKVSDLRDAGRVVIRPVSPEFFLLVPSGDYDATPGMAICVQTRRGADGKPFEYAEVVSPNLIRTYADGEPRGLGGRKPEYPNALGFVPWVETPHLASGDALGECTFQNVMPLLDELNALASDLGAIISKHVEPQWTVSGVEDGDLKRGDNVWYIPDPQGKASALVAPIDIAGVLGFIREIRDNVHAGLPELAFDELRSKAQVATATVELQLMELVVKIGLVRPNYDHALTHALRLAGKAAATMVGGDEASALYDVARLDDDALAFDAEREIVPLDPMTRAQIEKVQAEAAAAQAKAMARP